jgi:hypothetical protein
MKLLAIGYLFLSPFVMGKIELIQINHITTIQPKAADDLVGDWKLSLETYDDNHNKKLDDAERKKGFPNHYFYRFSADGSCIISPFASNQLKSGFKGHYVVDEKNGKKIITTYWDEAEQKGQREAQYTVVSVNKDELVLLETTGDHTFWIFKKAE